MAMTEKQRRFCDEYLIDLNATQAAIRAGYSKKTANRIGPENLSKPVIKEYIEKRMAEKKKRLIADQDEVMIHLTAAMRGEITEEVVVVEGVGEGMSDARIVDKQISARERLRAAELLGKRYALFTDRLDNNIDGGVTIINDAPSENI